VTCPPLCHTSIDQTLLNETRKENAELKRKLAELEAKVADSGEKAEEEEKAA